MTIDTKAKIEHCAQILEGKLVDDAVGLDICIKGTCLGFPASLQALKPGFPFGLTYILEIDVMEEGKQANALEMTIMPRYARGFLGFITRLLLLESKGQAVGDKRFDSKYLLSFNDHNTAERFIKYPGVADKIESLYAQTKFTEMGIRAQAGIYLSQPTNFNAVSVDVVRATFKQIAELGQVLFEAF